MNSPTVRGAVSSRVYTLLSALLVALACAGASSLAHGAGMNVTVEPGMAKGPAGAPVTIVEFSDYQ